MLIPAGYKIIVEAPPGDFIEVIDLEDYDLSKSIASSSVMCDIREAIEEDINRT